MSLSSNLIKYVEKKFSIRKEYPTKVICYANNVELADHVNSIVQEPWNRLIKDYKFNNQGVKIFIYDDYDKYMKFMYPVKFEDSSVNHKFVIAHSALDSISILSPNKYDEIFVDNIIKYELCLKHELAHVAIYQLPAKIPIIWNEAFAIYESNELNELMGTPELDFKKSEWYPYFERIKYYAETYGKDFLRQKLIDGKFTK